MTSSDTDLRKDDDNRRLTFLPEEENTLKPRHSFFSKAKPYSEDFQRSRTFYKMDENVVNDEASMVDGALDINHNTSSPEQSTMQLNEIDHIRARFLKTQKMFSNVNLRCIAENMRKDEEMSMGKYESNSEGLSVVVAPPMHANNEEEKFIGDSSPNAASSTQFVHQPLHTADVPYSTKDAAIESSEYSTNANQQICIKSTEMMNDEFEVREMKHLKCD